MGGDDEFNINIEDDDHNATAGLGDDRSSVSGNQFDETSAPLVHPADSGPVSLGTTHAVHLLRERFGDEAANSPDKRKKASLTPPRCSSKFLVLATKDAVKVEQQEHVLGGPIRVRGKRGLWVLGLKEKPVAKLMRKTPLRLDPQLLHLCWKHREWSRSLLEKGKGPLYEYIIAFKGKKRKRWSSDWRQGQILRRRYTKALKPFLTDGWNLLGYMGNYGL
ncbi:hypothetical protein EYC84_005647 [Monilinia fructicola]|uniref:Uncharacterized protein n=1 Tax=Monilinia fructicola TaxID=38448 RepID=A0A5M9K5P1_MONFR|nr:hypothetical protein EYC84_005647 [Monilinia fructicola]